MLETAYQINNPQSQGLFHRSRTTCSLSRSESFKLEPKSKRSDLEKLMNVALSYIILELKQAPSTTRTCDHSYI